MKSNDKPIGIELVLLALKTIKEGGTIDMLKLPDLTPEEETAFARRDTRAILADMLKKHGIEMDDLQPYCRSENDPSSA